MHIVAGTLENLQYPEPLNPLVHFSSESGRELLLEDCERAQTEAGGKTKTVYVVSSGYASPPFLVTRKITRIKSQVGQIGKVHSGKKCMLENIVRD